MINLDWSYKNWKLWILIAFFFKAIIFLYAISKEDNSDIPGFWGHFDYFDSNSYILPIENFVEAGKYTPDYRMPGYGIFYLPFYYLLGERALALNSLIIMQLIVASVATYCVGLIAHRLFNYSGIFYLTFIAYSISTFTGLFDAAVLTESLTTSFLIIAIYLFIQYFTRPQEYLLIAIGFLITIVFFMRPIFLPIIGLFIFLFIINLRKRGLFTIRAVIIFCVPFLFTETIWIARNYMQHNRLVPLTTSVYYPETERDIIFPLIKFLQTWGGKTTYWDPEAEIRWFGEGSLRKFGKGVSGNVEIPDYIYTSRFNRDSLEILRSKYIAFRSDTIISDYQRSKYEIYIRDRLEQYSVSVKSEKPFLYYVGAPLIYLKKFLVHSGTYNLFDKSFIELNLFEKGIKIFYSLLYLYVFVVGFAGICLSILEHKFNFKIQLIAGIPIYVILIHPLLRIIEPRYLVPAWPFMLIFAMYLTINCIKNLNKKVYGN